MDVPDPQVRLRILQHHLEIDASKSGDTASDQNSDEPRCGIHRAGCNLVPSTARALHLDDPDTRGQQEQRNPFVQVERLVQEENRKSGSSEDLDLVRDLKRRGVKVLRSDVLQVVLDDWWIKTRPSSAPALMTRERAKQDAP